MVVTTLALVAAALGGLCIGSFLNVVIHRLPRMLEARWQDDCFSLANPDALPPARRALTAVTAGMLTTLAVVLVFERLFLVRLP